MPSRKPAIPTPRTSTVATQRRAAPAKKTAPSKASAEPAPKPVEALASKPSHKLVRDSFTIPKSEYEVLGALKQRAVTLARPTKKSELLRAGIGLLSQLTDKAFMAAIMAVPSLKTGRPTKAPASGAQKAPKK